MVGCQANRGGVGKRIELQRINEAKTQLVDEVKPAVTLSFADGYLAPQL